MASLTPLAFFRQFVHVNTPVILTNAVGPWPAFSRWAQLDYLEKILGDLEVSVSVTPSGCADAIHTTPAGELRFVKPWTCSRRFIDFSAKLRRDADTRRARSRRRGSGRTVGAQGAVIDGESWYLQQQNDCLRTDYQRLWGDVSLELPWATEAFGGPPDSVNFWMGSSDAFTSLHKDPYENIYAVVRGAKHFTLYSPFDHPFLGETLCRAASFVPPGSAGADWAIVDDTPESWVPWLRADQDATLQHATPIRCTVGPGEVLYLPALWFHAVAQDDLTCAVNFWYDMAHTPAFSALQFFHTVAPEYLATR
eukprot:TRINITY_DN13807_c0_g1_i1.p1 TRINITY_DN13807_c0_g1~~TRINITY_DN13807_c0_g1_i1.p1  ORF type:complete len:346 (+),score=49.10 TRINITY_DN13807_c0_g1_i1:113-1039(+)